MILVGVCYGDGGERFRRVVLPALKASLKATDEIDARPGSGGLAATYNEILSRARVLPDLAAVVLMHDDVEIIDPNFRAKVLAASRKDNVGIVGVVGGSGLRSAKWWEARSLHGLVYESRGVVAFASRHADVDVVDGLMMILSPAAVHRLAFDSATCPGYHGYDVDICLAARDLGMRVLVEPIEVLHRTKGGYGDQPEFEATQRRLLKKWKTWIRVDRSIPWGLRRKIRMLRTFAHRARWTVWRRAHPNSQAQPSATEVASHDPQVYEVLPEVPRGLECVCCGGALTAGTSSTQARLLNCFDCGTVTIWPPPGRDVSGGGLWVERYRGTRLKRRSTWLKEARTRLDWVQLYVPHGEVLEVGAGTGEFCKVCADSGFLAVGIEPSDWAAGHARGLGADVRSSDLDEYLSTNPDHRFDAVAMWHVLEHVPDPIQMIRQAGAALKPGGRVFIEVPNAGSSEFHRLGIEWDGTQPQDHYHIFSRAGLMSVFQRAGFSDVEVLEISNRPYLTTTAWIQSRNTALLNAHQWPSLEFLRVVAGRPENSPETQDCAPPNTAQGHSLQMRVPTPE